MELLTEKRRGYIKQWSIKFSPVCQEIAPEDLKVILPYINIYAEYEWSIHGTYLTSTIFNQMHNKDNFLLILEADKDKRLNVSAQFNELLSGAIRRKDHPLIEKIISHPQFTYPGKGTVGAYLTESHYHVGSSFIVGSLINFYKNVSSLLMTQKYYDSLWEPIDQKCLDSLSSILPIILSCYTAIPKEKGQETFLIHILWSVASLGFYSLIPHLLREILQVKPDLFDIPPFVPMNYIPNKISSNEVKSKTESNQWMNLQDCLRIWPKDPKKVCWETSPEILRDLLPHIEINRTINDGLGSRSVFNFCDCDKMTVLLDYDKERILEVSYNFNWALNFCCLEKREDLIDSILSHPKFEYPGEGERSPYSYIYSEYLPCSLAYTIFNGCNSGTNKVSQSERWNFCLIQFLKIFSTLKKIEDKIVFVGHIILSLYISHQESTLPSILWRLISDCPEILKYQANIKLRLD